MAQFSEQEQNAMRRDAARRAQEMQRRVHPTASPGDGLPSQFADYPPETSAPEPEPTPKPQPPKLPLLGFAAFNPADFCPILMATPC